MHSSTYKRLAHACDQFGCTVHSLYTTGDYPNSVQGVALLRNADRRDCYYLTHYCIYIHAPSWAVDFYSVENHTDGNGKKDGPYTLERALTLFVENCC